MKTDKVRSHKSFGNTEESSSFSEPNLNLGLLAELADALDSKSNSTIQNTSVKPAKTESPVICFINALAKLGSQWPGIAPELRAGITSIARQIVDEGKGAE